MHKLAYFFLIISYVVVLAGVLHAQKQVISSEEFSNSYYSAVEKAEPLAKSFSSEAKRFRGGKVYWKEDWTIESLPSFRTRSVRTTLNEGVTERLESVIIEEHNYCKRNDQRWRKVDVPCLFQPIDGFLLNITGSSYSVEEAVEDGNKFQIFREYATYNNQSPNAGEWRGESFKERAHWLDEKGLVVRRTEKLGSMNSGKVSYELVQTHRYNPDGLKIEAPIP